MSLAWPPAISISVLKAPVSFKTAMIPLVFCGWHDQYGLLKTYFQISPNHSFSNWCINFRYIYQVSSWITYLTLCSCRQLFSTYNKSLSMVWLEIGPHSPRVVISRPVIGRGCRLLKRCQLIAILQLIIGKIPGESNCNRFSVTRIHDLVIKLV